MRRFLPLLAKDLRRRAAEPAGLFLNLAIPMALAGTMALAFGNLGGKGPEVPPLKIVFVDLDQGPFSRLVAGSSQNEEVASRLRIQQAASREAGLALMQESDAAALLVIPKGFGDALTGGERADLELVKNPAQSVMPIVAQQGAEVVALYASAAARFIGEDAERLKRLTQGEGWSDAVGIAAMILRAYRNVTAAEALLFPPLIEVKTEKRKEEMGGFNWMAWMFPGMVVMGLLFVGIMQMRDLLRERRSGTLRRQIAAPTTPARILLAKVLSAGLVVAVALLLLLGAGTLAFGIHWGALAPLAATSVLLVFAVTGFAALLFSLVRTERQGDAFGGILVMVMSLLGGSFVPPQVLPEWLGTLSKFTVNHWAHEALRALATGGGWDTIATHLVVLGTMGVITTGAGMALLGWRHVRGAL